MRPRFLLPRRLSFDRPRLLLFLRRSCAQPSRLPLPFPFAHHPPSFHARQVPSSSGLPRRLSFASQLCPPPCVQRPFARRFPFLLRRRFAPRLRLFTALTFPRRRRFLFAL